jgi:hypothetical protein
MLTAPTYDEICESLNYYMSPRGHNQRVRLVGIMFCQPHSKFTKEEILPALRYFHFRSGEHVNFYFAGYGQGFDPSPGQVMALSPAEGPGWIFDAEAFNDVRGELERRTTWRYGGGSELLLANAHFDVEKNSSALDFTSAVSISFERLKHDGALPDVGILFERIFRYAEGCSGDDATWGFSDQEAGKLVGNALKNLVLSTLPSALRQDAKTAFHLVTHNFKR